jgi:hypothetical protein
MRTEASSEKPPPWTQPANAARRAKALIGQILTYSRSTRGKRSVMRMCETADEVLLLVRASLPANIELRTRLAAPSAQVMADLT